jgi:hypothetical protein
MPIVYVLGLRHDISSAIATVAFGVGGILVMGIVFGDKYFSLLKLTSSTPKVLDATQPSSSQSSATGPNNTVQLYSQAMIRSMKPDEQFEYYTKIIQKYTALRLQLNSGDSSASQMDSSNSNQCLSSAEADDDGRLSTLPQSTKPRASVDFHVTDV